MRPRTRLSQWVLIAIALCALLLPLYAPMIDHHYAERVPDHAHIYLGEVIENHDHPYAETHDHDPSDEIVSLDLENEIIFLMTNRATITLVEPILADHSLPILEEVHLVFALPDDAPLEADAFIRPPKIPPRHSGEYFFFFDPARTI